MTKRIVSLLLIAVMVIGLLAACGKDGPLTADDAKAVALEDMGIKEKHADSVDTHLGTDANGVPCYFVYITIDGEHWEYVVDGISGEILSKEETDSGHSH